MEVTVIIKGQSYNETVFLGQWRSEGIGQCSRINAQMIIMTQERDKRDDVCIAVLMIICKKEVEREVGEEQWIGGTLSGFWSQRTVELGNYRKEPE